jgi:hypothetical protein
LLRNITKVPLMANLAPIQQTLAALEAKYANPEDARWALDPRAHKRDQNDLVHQQTALTQLWQAALKEGALDAALACLPVQQRIQQIQAILDAILDAHEDDPPLMVGFPTPVDKSEGLAVLAQGRVASALALLAGTAVTAAELRAALPAPVPSAPDSTAPTQAQRGSKSAMIGAGVMVLLFGTLFLLINFLGPGDEEATPLPITQVVEASATPAATSTAIASATPTTQATRVAAVPTFTATPRATNTPRPPTATATPSILVLRSVTMQGIIPSYAYTGRVASESGAAFTRMRAEPDVNSERLDELRAGDQIDVLNEEVPGWYQVRLQSNGSIGWIERWLVDNVGVPPAPTATRVPTPRPPAARALRFRLLNNNDNPRCISIQITGASTAGWRFVVDGVAVNNVQLTGRFDGAGNARVCNLPSAGQQVTITVFNQNGQVVPGGAGVPTKGGAVMLAPWS